MVRLPSSARRAPGQILSPETDTHEGRHLRAVVLGEAEAEGYPRTPRHVRAYDLERSARFCPGPKADELPMANLGEELSQDGCLTPT